MEYTEYDKTVNIDGHCFELSVHCWPEDGRIASHATATHLNSGDEASKAQMEFGDCDETIFTDSVWSELCDYENECIDETENE